VRRARRRRRQDFAQRSCVELERKIQSVLRLEWIVFWQLNMTSGKSHSKPDATALWGLQFPARVHCISDCLSRFAAGRHYAYAAWGGIALGARPALLRQAGELENWRTGRRTAEDKSHWQIAPATDPVTWSAGAAGEAPQVLRLTAILRRAIGYVHLGLRLELELPRRCSSENVKLSGA